MRFENPGSNWNFRKPLEVMWVQKTPKNKRDLHHYRNIIDILEEKEPQITHLTNLFILLKLIIIILILKE